MTYIFSKWNNYFPIVTLFLPSPSSPLPISLSNCPTHCFTEVELLEELYGWRWDYTLSTIFQCDWGFCKQSRKNTAGWFVSRSLVKSVFQFRTPLCWVAAWQAWAWRPARETPWGRRSRSWKEAVPSPHVFLRASDSAGLELPVASRSCGRQSTPWLSSVSD